MTDKISPLPVRRPELAISPLGEQGMHVVKDPASGDYFHLGAVEAFLLEQLDGQQTSAQICAAFEAQFDDTLTEEELADFLELAKSRGFLLIDSPLTGSETQAPAAQNQTRKPPAPRRQSILYWRKSFFDPDRLFNWLEPKVRFLWTRAFLIVSAVAILTAMLVTWANGQQLLTQFNNSLRWETILLGLLTMIAVITCHEFAHGLTCKHHGGEVHELGFLLMFFMPCFYCNVSDAWLFREKSKRLWVTLAGAYCDLCVWALAVFVWRVTYQDNLLNYLAWVVMSVTGVRAFFNLNPLIRLDGYYLLSDALEIPNLRQRGVDYTLSHLRWLLWGAERPVTATRGNILLPYGLMCWLFSLTLITMILVGLGKFLSASVGPIGLAVPMVLSVKVGRGLLSGMFTREFTKMVWQRPKRRTVWLIAIAVVAIAAFVVPITDRAKGTFVLRPVTRVELRAPTAAFLRDVYFDEGEEVAKGDIVAQLEIHDLESRIAQTVAESREAEAQRRQLQGQPLGLKLSSEKLTERLSRIEGLNAATAHANQLSEKLNHLQQLKKLLPITAPISGCLVTPRMKEKAGSYFQEGDLICEIERLSTLEAEVSVHERDATRLCLGQKVSLKAEAFPFAVFECRVERISPRAISGDLQSTITIYCKLEVKTEQLRPGMTGNARIDCGRVTLGILILRRAIRLFRTEFWW